MCCYVDLLHLFSFETVKHFRYILYEVGCGAICILFVQKSTGQQLEALLEKM